MKSSTKTLLFSFSGAEDSTVDMAVKPNKNRTQYLLWFGPVLHLNLRVIEQIRKHYKKKSTLLSPDRNALKTSLMKKALFTLFWRRSQVMLVVFESTATQTQTGNTWMPWLQARAERAQIPGTVSIGIAEKRQPPFSTDEKGPIQVQPLTNWSSRL